MNILQICYDTQSAPTRLAELAMKGFQPPDKVVMVYLTGTPEGLLNENCIYLNKNCSPFWRLSVLMQLYRLCCKHRFDILITHRNKPFWLGTLLAHLVPFKKKIALFHDIGELKRKKRQWFARLFAQTWEVVGISKVVQQDLKNAQVFRPSAIHSIENAIDIASTCERQFTRPDAREKLGLEPHDFVFGTIGRLIPKKGHMDLLEAFALLRKQYPEKPLKLVLIGSGQMHDALQATIGQRGLEGQVKLTGYLDEASRYVPAFDAFVFPSHNEAFGVALLEAMAARCPIIGIRSGGIPEVLGEEGVLVPPHAPQELSHAMAGFLEQTPDDRLRQGTALYRRLCERFSQTRYWSDYRRLMPPMLFLLFFLLD